MVDIFFLLSVVVAFASLVGGFMLEGGHVGALLAPTAAIIVIGGSIGATLISFPMSDLKRVPAIFKVLLFNRKEDKEKIINDLKELSVKVRKEGLLSLESELSNGSYDPFMVHGLQLVTDGIDGELIRASLESRIDNMEYRHSKAISIFEAIGGYSPTMGVIGTVMGLVHVLGDMSDVDSLTSKIGMAFIATLYGVGMANVLWLPIANRLKQLDADEILTKSMIIEGVMLIYSGSNVSLVEERLRGFLGNASEKRAEGEQ